MTRRREGERGTVTPRVGTGERGQAIVEFALMVPFLLVLVLAICDFGLATITKGTTSYAGRQGARLLESYGASSSDPDSAVVNAITTTLQAGGLTLNNLQSITIFRSNPGSPGDAGATPGVGDTPGLDRVYTFNNGTLSGSPSGAYSVGETPSPQHGDFAGITIRYHYRGITPLLAGGIDIVDVTHTRIDPDTIGVALPTPVPPPTVSAGP